MEKRIAVSFHLSSSSPEREGIEDATTIEDQQDSAELSFLMNTSLLLNSAASLDGDMPYILWKPVSLVSLKVSVFVCLYFEIV